MNTFKLASLIENKYNLLKLSQDNQVSDEVKKYIKDYILDRDGRAEIEKIHITYGSGLAEGKSHLDGFAADITNIRDELNDIANDRYEDKNELIQKLEKIRSFILALYNSSGEDKYHDYHNHYFHLAQLFWYIFPVRKNTLGLPDNIQKDGSNTRLNRLKNYLSTISNRIQEDIYPKLNVLKKYDKDSKSFISPVTNFHLIEDSVEPLTPSEAQNALNLFQSIIDIPSTNYQGWQKYLNNDSKEKIRKAYRSYMGPGAGIEGTDKAKIQLANGGKLGPAIDVVEEYSKSSTGKVTHRKVINQENLNALLSVKSQISERKKQLGESPIVEESVKSIDLDPLKEKDSKIKRKLKKDGYDDSAYQRKWLKLNDRIRLGLSYGTFLELLSLKDSDYNKVTKDDKSIISFIKDLKEKGKEKALKNNDEDSTAEQRTANINKRMNLLVKLCNFRG